jgi:hypothetical protein
MQKAGGFSEDRELIAAEDYDAWLRVARHTDQFVMLNDCLGYYSIGNDNISSADRNITNLYKLLDIYSNELKISNYYPPHWISFSFAKSYYKKKEIELCISYLLLIVKSDSSINIQTIIFKIKSIIYLLFAIVDSMFHRLKAYF